MWNIEWISIELINLNWKTMALICFTMKNGPSLWWFNFYNGLVVLICCCRNQIRSATLKLGCYFLCSSTFSLYRLWVSSRLNTTWAWTSANHMAWSSTYGFMTLCTPWMSNLWCKPWFVKKNVCWVNECIVLL